MTKYILPIICALGIFSACTKTTERLIDKEADPVYDTLTSDNIYPIVSYQVLTSNEQGIYANVDDKNKVITVFLPYFYQLQFLETNIQLGEGVTISPDPTELVPVFSETPVVYTVTDKKGIKTTYELKVITQQPDMQLNEMSTERRTRTVSGGYLAVTGSNLLPSYNVTSLYLVDKDGNEVCMLNGLMEQYKTSSSYMAFTTNGADVSKISGTETYWIEIRSYMLTRRMKYPVRILL